MKAVAGNYDFIQQSLVVKNFKSDNTARRRAATRSDTWKSGNAEQLLQLQHELAGRSLQKAAWDVRFCRAMSVAINRDEINEVLYRHGNPVPVDRDNTSRAYKEEYARPGPSTTWSWRTSCSTRWA